MTNEISTIGFVSGQDFGTPTSSKSQVVHDLAGYDLGFSKPQFALQPELPTPYYSEHVSRKDELAQVAASINALNDTRQIMGDRVSALTKAVNRVKDYPPFPPGNDQRERYISSLNSLRKEIESLTVPPEAVAGGTEALPLDQSMPLLDPVNATDSDVGRLGNAIRDAWLHVNAHYTDLQAKFAQLSDKIQADLPAPPKNEGAAGELATSIAASLAGSGRAVETNNYVLVRLAG